MSNILCDIWVCIEGDVMSRRLDEEVIHIGM